MFQLDTTKTVADILQLRLENEGKIWLAANVLEYCWHKRSEGRKAELVECIAKLKYDVRLLSSSKYLNIASQLGEVL